VDRFFVDCQASTIPEQRIFELLKQLLEGFPIDLLNSEVNSVLEVASFLGNSELHNQFIDNSQPFDQSTVCYRMRNDMKNGLSLDDEIEFTAAHFYEIDSTGLNEIDVSVVERILKSNALRLESEDSLLEFIGGLDWNSQFVLLRSVRVEYVSGNAMGAWLARLPDEICAEPIKDFLLCRLSLDVSPRYAPITSSRFAQAELQQDPDPSGPPTDAKPSDQQPPRYELVASLDDQWDRSLGRSGLAGEDRDQIHAQAASAPHHDLG
jgi:hypothetical protein